MYVSHVLPFMTKHSFTIVLNYLCFFGTEINMLFSVKNYKRIEYMQLNILSIENGFRIIIIYSLRDGKSRDRIPMKERFSANLQTVPGAHSASYIMGTGSYPGAKRSGRGVNHPPTSSAKVKERVELYLYCPSVPLGQVIG